MPKILFRADAGMDNGTGDLLSIIYLSEYFLGWDRYFMVKDTPVARKITRKQKIHRVKLIPSELNAHKEISLINDFIKDNRISAFFSEITTGNISIYNKVRARFRGCIDFFGDFPKDFDLVVNWDVESQTLYQKFKNSNILFLLGPKYVVLRKGIECLVKQIKKKSYQRSTSKKILIFLGGIDRFNFTFSILKTLETSGYPFRVRAILGAGFTYEKGVKEFVKYSKSCHFYFYRNVENMIPHYKWADFVITAGGLSLFETIALRKPAAIVATERHQIKRCVFFSKRRIIKYLGFRKFNKQDLISAITKKRFKYYNNKFLVSKIPQIINERLKNKL